MHHFWYYLSDKLQSLYDPDTCDFYQPLLLSARWWKHAYSNKGEKASALYHSKYNVSAEDVLNELWFLTMKFRTISEILYQSNPSLNVIINYDIKNDNSSLNLTASCSTPTPTTNKLSNKPNNKSPPCYQYQSQLFTPPSIQYTLSNTTNSPITPSLNNNLPHQILQIKSILSEEHKFDDNDNYCGHHRLYLSPQTSLKKIIHKNPYIIR